MHFKDRNPESEKKKGFNMLYSFLKKQIPLIHDIIVSAPGR